MKGFVAALLCFFALVQARSTGVQNGPQTFAAPGDAPWFVHLRLAVSNAQGALKTCAGALIDETWVLTTADCARSKTFAWIRYGTVDALQPSLVTENSGTTNPPIVNPNANLALINVRRVVQTTETISPVAIATEVSEVESATFFAFGEDENGKAGRHLARLEVTLQVDGETLVAQSNDGQATQSDLGAPLVIDGKLVALLDKPGNGDNAAVFITLASHIEWIESTTGLKISA